MASPSTARPASLAWATITLLLVVTACDCGDEKSSIPPDAEVDGELPDVVPTEPECEETSDCASGEFCDSRQMCCEFVEACGSACCRAGEVCEAAVCHLACAEDETRCEDSSGAQVCCADGELCVSGGCFEPTTACTDFIDCPDGEYCESSIDGGVCLPRAEGPACELIPTGADVQPTIAWQWPPRDASGEVVAALVPEPNYHQVMMAPMVANLNDDNGDGVVDEDDIPDVVFNTFFSGGGSYTRNGILRAVSGADGSLLFSVTASNLRAIGGAQVAIGDIDGDGLPEIVTCASETENVGTLIAVDNEGNEKWRATAPEVRCGQAAPTIADLDGDGQVEVFVRYTVVDGATGALLAHEPCGVFVEPTDSHDACDYTTAANLDDEDDLELVGGNVAFKFTRGAGLAPLWDFRSCTPDPERPEHEEPCRRDGYPAVADFDLDGRPEVVVVEAGRADLSLTTHKSDHFLVVRDGLTGALRAGPVDINVLEPYESHLEDCSEFDGKTYCAIGGGGPPTVGNFDPSDPNPEIALAGAYNYVVFDVSLGGAPADRLEALWHKRTHDFSSRKTGSSLFDFDGDGTAEVVYNDQDWLRVYDGLTGDTRFCRCNFSATLWEYPVIADVDNDGHAEIVVATNDYNRGIGELCPAVEGDPCTEAEIAAGRAGSAPAGITVYRGPGEGWVGTRRIWNQHTYHVTNITESGRVPPVETRNWSISALNNFRLNVQPGATYQPDLRPRNLSASAALCGEPMVIYAEIYNAGWAAVPAGVPVSLYRVTDTTSEHIATVMTSRRLLPGEVDLVQFEFTPQSVTVTFEIIANDAGDGTEPAALECDYENNVGTLTATCFIGGPG